jgi:FMN-dependent NADH-azoreductase
MTKLLVIQSATRDTGSHSRRLVDEFAERLARAGSFEIRTRDLLETSIPHVSDRFVQAIRTEPEALTSAHRADLELSDNLIQELFWADVILLGVPMYNLGIPSILKAYLDHVIRSGVTFQSSPEGIKGLLKGRRAFVIASRGGVYDGPRVAADFQIPYLKTILGMIGIEVIPVAVDGAARGPEVHGANVAAARVALAQHFALTDVSSGA